MKHLEIAILEPAVSRREFDTVDSEGIESKMLGHYRVAYDEKRQQWLGGRSDGSGPTVQRSNLPDLLADLGLLIVRDYY